MRLSPASLFTLLSSCHRLYFFSQRSSAFLLQPHLSLQSASTQVGQHESALLTVCSYRCMQHLHDDEAVTRAVIRC